MSERDFSSRLTDELEQWVQIGLVDTTTAARIKSRYSVEPDNRRARAGGLIALLGALLIGAGAIAFIASSWTVLSQVLKLAIMIVLLVSTGAVGYRLRFGMSKLRQTGAALLFLTTALYGACVFLTAASFQIPVDTPVLLFVWAAGTLPVAIICTSKAQWLVGLLVLVTGIAWIAALWMQETVPWVLIVLFCFGILLHAGGKVFETSSVARPFQNITQITGLLIVQLVLIPLGFRGLLEGIDTHGVRGVHPDSLFVPTILAVVTTGLICFGAFLVSMRSVKDRIQLGIYIVGLCMVPSPIVMEFVSPTLWSVMINALILTIVLALIINGIYERNTVSINVAIICFVLQVACRYGELLWGKVPPEMFFTLLGLLLLVGGMFIERGRRRLLLGMGDVSTHEVKQ